MQTSVSKDLRTGHTEPVYRLANIDDLDALVRLEDKSFASDRLARRNFSWMIRKAHAFH